MVAGHLQEKKGFWYIVLTYTENGLKQSKWKSTGLPVKNNKKKAEKMLQQERLNFRMATEYREVSLEGIKKIPLEEMNFADYMLYWLDMVKHTIEESTYTGYSYGINKRIVPYFNELGIKLTEVKPRHIQDFYTHCFGLGLSANTIKRHHANIRKALQSATISEVILFNPADRLEKFKAEQYIGSYYNRQEVIHLLDAVRGEKIEFAVVMASYYGLRRSEVIGLKWEAIDFERKTITINHTVVTARKDGQEFEVAKNRTKNKSSYRVLPLIKEVEKLLVKVKKENIENQINNPKYSDAFSEYIYVDKNGIRVKPNYVSQTFRDFLDKRQKKRIRYHDLRHSCASLLLANGISMKEIQEWLGHSDYATTANIYAHLESSKISSATAIRNCLVENFQIKVENFA